MTMLSRPVAGGRAILAALLLAGAVVAPAAAEGMFAATVSVQGLDSPDAARRDAAIARAEGAALAAVLRRLTAERDHDRLPPAEGPNVAGYIRDVSILGDGGRARIATRPEAVRQLLEGIGVDYVETAAPTLVVVPVYRTDAGPVLWSGANPWLDAWQDHGGASGLVPLVVPFGEFGDLDALNAREALDGSPAALRALALRYDAAGTLVAHYTPSGGQAEVALSIAADGDWHEATRLALAQDQPNAAAGIAAVLTAVERLWVERHIRPRYDGPLSSMELTATFSDLPDWVAIRHALDRAPIVARYDVPVLGGRSARILLQHYADAATLQRDLAGAGLVLGQGGFSATGFPAMTLSLAGARPPDQPWPDHAGTPAPGAPPAPSRPDPFPDQTVTAAPRIPALRFEP